MSTSISALPIVRISTGVEIDEDFALSIAFTLADGVTPINLSGIVFAGEIDGPLTFSLGDGIVSGADDNVLTFAVPAAAKADWPAGAYDLTILATDSTVSPEISRDLLGFSTLTVGAPQVPVISVLKQAASGPPAAVSWVPANLASLAIALLESSGLGLVIPAINIAGLRANAFANLTNGAVAFLQGYHVAGDDGSGFFQWNASSTASDDGGLTINPAGNAGAGRWLRLLAGNVVTPQMFGAYANLVRNNAAVVTATSGSPTASTSAAILTAAQVGQYVTLNAPSYATWSGILESVSGSSFTLSTNAPWNAAAVTMRLQCAGDDSAAINAAIASGYPAVIAGFFGAASGLTLPNNGFRVSGSGANVYIGMIVAMAAMTQMLMQGTTNISGGLFEDLFLDGNKLAASITVVDGAANLQFRDATFYNAASNANFIAGDGVSNSHQNHFDNILCLNDPAIFAPSECPSYNYYVNATDNTFLCPTGANAQVCNFFSTSTAYNTNLLHPHMWSTSGYQPPNQYSIGASANITGPVIDNFGANGILILGPDVTIIGGRAEGPLNSSSSAITIAASLSNVKVIGFDASVVTNSLLRVVQNTPIGSNNIVAWVEGNGSAERTDLGTGNTWGNSNTESSAVGNFNTITGSKSVALGQNGVLAGSNSTSLSIYGADWTANGAIVAGCGQFSSVKGSMQSLDLLVAQTTTNNTPTYLTTTQATTLATFNSVPLPSSGGLYGSWAGTCEIITRDANGDTAFWLYSVAFKRNASGVTLTGPTLISSQIDSALSACAITFGVDGTNFVGWVKGAGIAATTLNWVARFKGVMAMA